MDLDESSLILMLKDKATGLLTKEMGVYRIQGNMGFLSGAYAFDNEGDTEVLLKLTTERDVKDSEFFTMFENYDAGAYDEESYVIEIAEAEDCYNPEWEMTIEFSPDEGVMEERINKVLRLHKEEVNRLLGKGNY